MELAEQSYRPSKIIQLKQEIEGRMRVAELKESVLGRIDPADVAEIVEMKRALDGLYCLWVEGKL
ncbi:MAG: hypothetical protein HY460_01610 [Parcubacteria group bacterium]|nr:hypothetical protein [Parcubacteria group bacterium]